MDFDEIEIVDSDTKLTESTIQHVLSNPEFLQQLMSSQIGSPSSDIQGLKIGDRVLPVRIYERDGKKTMQIALSENAFDDNTGERNEVLNIEMAADTDQLLETVDDYIDNFSLQSLPMPNASLQDTGMDFVQNTPGFDGMLASSGVYPVSETSYFNTTSSMCTEAPAQTIPVVYSNEENVKLEPVDFHTTIIPPKYESILPSTSHHIAAPPEQDIVAAAFHESGILQATANAIQAAKIQYKDKIPMKKSSRYTRGRSQYTTTTTNKVLFTCSYGNCRRKFRNKTGLDIHLYSHTGLKPVTCKLCEKSFLSIKLLDKHKCKFNRPLQEMKGVQFNCDLCDKSFGNLGTLVVHKRSHRGSKPYTCGLCAKAFTLKSSMYKHVKSHGSDVRYKCQTCEEMFRSPWHLEEHLMSHMNEKKVYNCSQCTKIYTNYTHYIRHVKSHSLKGKHGDMEISNTQVYKEMDTSEGLKCNVCFKLFNSVSGFQQHMLIHGPKRFKCSECSKCFASKEYLQNHLQWYIAKYVLGTTDPGHTKVIEKYKITNNLDVSEYLEILDHEEIENSPTMNQEEELIMENDMNDDLNKTYLCDICGNYFFSERALKRHIKFHDNIPYKCSHCDKKFSFRSNLVRHELTHTERMDFQCNLCDKSFARQSFLDEHCITHSSIKPYSCNVCNKKFSRISNLRRHKQLHAEKKYKCPECDRGFVCPRYLKEHVQNIHTSMGRKVQECPICNMELSGSSNLNRHLNLHYGTNEQNKKLECEVCRKKFEFKSDMDVHMRSHTGEKPFTCEKCDKGFMSMSNLRRHYITHMETKAHVCELCGKAFKIERYLLDHKKIHTHPTKVTCEICGQSFSSNTNMKRHKLIHTGEKPYACNICQKLFRSKPDVERHRLIHFREKTDQCPLCLKMFKHAELLRRHMEKHERGIPTCTVCNKQFPTNYKLQRHQATHQDNFICNVCDSTFKTSLQLQKHVETHDITEMRKLLLNMGTMKNGSPVNANVKTEPKIAPKTKAELNQTSRKIRIQPVTSSAGVAKIQQTSSGNISILAPKAGTSIITQIPFSSSLSNISNVSQIHLSQI